MSNHGNGSGNANRLPSKPFLGKNVQVHFLYGLGVTKHQKRNSDNTGQEQEQVHKRIQRVS
jgi:hypothetical protein